MEYSYYPGCTLKTKAKDLDRYARASAQALGFALEELPEWQCCGGAYPMSQDEIATKLSSVRALAAARDQGRPLVTLCSACHNVLKQVNHEIAVNADMQARANNYMGLDVPYAGEATVLHYLEVLRDQVGFDEVKKRVVKPFTGVKIAAYYGCLLLRPGKVMAMDLSLIHISRWRWPSATCTACAARPRRWILRASRPSARRCARPW